MDLRTITPYVGALAVLLGSATAHADGTVGRVLSTGLADTSFSSDGFEYYSEPGGSVYSAKFLDLALSGPSVVAVGSSILAGQEAMLIVKYTSSGALDLTFGGGDGVVLHAVPTYTRSGATGVEIDSSGRIVVSGWAHANFARRFVVARYLANGTLDATFNGTGLNVTDFASSSDEAAFAIDIAPDGKIVTAGFANVDGDWHFGLVRYLTTGALDTTFDGDGKVLTWWSGTEAVAWAVTHDSNGKIIPAGTANGRMALARYNTNGTLDTSLDVDGKAWVDFDASADDQAADVAVDSSGRIVIVGWTETQLDSLNAARFTAAGVLDTSFSGDGKVETAAGLTGGYGIGFTSTGALVVASSRDAGSFSYQAVVRYTSAGALDTTFSGDGRMDIGSGDASACVIDGSGRVVIAGSSY